MGQGIVQEAADGVEDRLIRRIVLRREVSHRSHVTVHFDDRIVMHGCRFEQSIDTIGVPSHVHCRTIAFVVRDQHEVVRRKDMAVPVRLCDHTGGVRPPPPRRRGRGGRGVLHVVRQSCAARTSSPIKLPA
jgi:hypothetical protein